MEGGETHPLSSKGNQQGMGGSSLLLPSLPSAPLLVPSSSTSRTGLGLALEKGFPVVGSAAAQGPDLVIAAVAVRALPPWPLAFRRPLIAGVRAGVGLVGARIWKEMIGEERWRLLGKRETWRGLGDHGRGLGETAGGAVLGIGLGFHGGLPFIPLR
jgi:hypothetical protein